MPLEPVELQFPSLAGDGLLVVEVTGEDEFRLRAMKGTGEIAILDDVSLADLRRIISRLKDAIDIRKDVAKRGLEAVVKYKKRA